MHVTVERVLKLLIGLIMCANLFLNVANLGRYIARGWFLVGVMTCFVLWLVSQTMLNWCHQDWRR